MSLFGMIGRGKRARGAARRLASDPSHANYAALAREFVMVGDTAAVKPREEIW